ncbi:two-component response regulator ORR9-like [Telopea speciosissima]|uniref:two-component response regulator ORR9-like n=1 Tax=Telopea speciosissima TaxID=54955 RepID=UPI001CC498D3|nr:two-component response regulator ORR9-like [Telopea speciosissima]
MSSSKAEDIEEDKQEEEEQQQQQQHFHVLAVDDNLVDRMLLERLLTVSSYQVTCVESGDKALEYLGLLANVDHLDSTSSSSSSSSPPSEHEGDQTVKMKVNLIMTDYSMPGMTGYDLLKRVKKSSWKDIPVVVMSSENVPSRINMCLEGGAEEFLLKPVQLSDLEKLQPHLLKSLTCKCNFSTTTTNDSSSNSNNNGININCNSDNSIENKRRAVSPEPAERIPKLKGLTVM